jgi:hypothetical protein
VGEITDEQRQVPSANAIKNFCMISFSVGIDGKSGLCKR